MPAGLCPAGQRYNYGSIFSISFPLALLLSPAVSLMSICCEALSLSLRPLPASIPISPCVYHFHIHFFLHCLISSACLFPSINPSFSLFFYFFLQYSSNTFLQSFPPHFSFHFMFFLPHHIPYLNSYCVLCEAGNGWKNKGREKRGHAQRK